MKNAIEKIREMIRQDCIPDPAFVSEKNVHISPGAKYYAFATEYYREERMPPVYISLGDNVYPVTERNFRFSKIEVYENATDETATDEKICEYVRNEDRPLIEWVEKDGVDYLICPEDFQGQSILDLTNRKLYSFSFEEGANAEYPADDFIWCAVFPSPDKNKLAVFGCNWGTPYYTTVFDFSNPTSLPYPVLFEEVDKFCDGNLRGWKDDSTLIIEEDISGEKQISLINILEDS